MRSNNFKFVCDIDCNGILRNEIKSVEEKMMQSKRNMRFDLAMVAIIELIVLALTIFMCGKDNQITSGFITFIVIAFFIVLIFYAVFCMPMFSDYWDLADDLSVLESISKPTFESLSKCKALNYYLRDTLKFADIVESNKILDIEDTGSSLQVIYQDEDGAPKSTNVEYERDSFKEEIDYFLIRRCGVFACTSNADKPIISMTCLGGDE